MPWIHGVCIAAIDWGNRQPRNREPYTLRGVTEKSIEDLRAELKSLGYLTHGLERWFARDPWKSSSFWGELILLACKAGALVSIFAVVPMAIVMVVRNWPIGPADVAIIAAIDLAGLFASMVALIVGSGLLLRARASLTIESPAALMSISMAASGVLSVGTAVWWLGFAEGPSPIEAAMFAATLLLSFAAGTVVVSAALLSFSIHESHTIPSIHRRPLMKPIAMTGGMLLLAVLVPVWLASQREEFAPDPQVVVNPTEVRIALIAVEGMTADLFAAQPDLSELFELTQTLDPIEQVSPAAMWATLGTGVSPDVHGVRAVEGIRILDGRVLQSVSQYDAFLRMLGPVARLTDKQALPPSVRLRRYLWEELARRGVRSAAVNWWATDDLDEPNLLSVSQMGIFGSSSGAGADPHDLAMEVDRRAGAEFVDAIERRSPGFATVYLPGLDILLNRIELSDGDRIAGSMTALRRFAPLVRAAADAQMEVILIGLPGVGQTGDGVLAVTSGLSLEPLMSRDLAPTILDCFGFPSSGEMVGKSRVQGSTQSSIPSFGPRSGEGQPVGGEEEYYESLRSLGYIQ